MQNLKIWAKKKVFFLLQWNNIYSGTGI